MVDKMESESSVRDPISTGLLINVIRTLISSVSDDQRELERSRLEKGHIESGLVIDRLLKEHRNDVKECLTSFRQISNDVTSCRERIHNVKNALLTCKSLLQCRHDDLKKLRMESAEHNYLSHILQQIHDIKHIDKTVEGFIEIDDYRSAVDSLKRADILLNGPLSQIDGLNQLRTNVTENTQNIFEKIVQDILQCVIVVPFDSQILELMMSLNEKQLDELPQCAALIEKYSTKLKNTLPPNYVPVLEHWANRSNATTGAQLKPVSALNVGVSNTVEESIREKMAKCLDALKIYDQLDSAITSVLSRVTSQCQRAITDMIVIMRSFMKDAIGDSTNFAQLCQLLIKQINDSAFRFHILLDELQKIRNETTRNLSDRFWDVMQDVLEAVVSDHLGIWRSDNEKPRENRRRNTKALFSFDNTSFAATANSSLLNKHTNLICPMSPYNLAVVFQVLNRFATKVEKEIGEDRVCKFSTYLRTFAIEAFIERVRSDLDAKIEHILNGAEVWSALCHIPSYNVKILTSCLRMFELCEMINDFILKMSIYAQRFAALWLLIIAEYTKTAAYMNSQANREGQSEKESIQESLQWFASRMREMINSLPEAALKIIQSRHIQIKNADSMEAVEQLLSDALQEQLGRLERTMQQTAN